MMCAFKMCNDCGMIAPSCHNLESPYRAKIVFDLGPRALPPARMVQAVGLTI